MASFRLEVTCGHTSFGQSVGVVGASAELGSWDPWRSLRLSTTPEDFPLWTGDVPSSIVGTEFKFVLVRPPDEVEWESISNRCWKQAEADAAQSGGAVLTTCFNDPVLRLRLQPSACQDPRRARALSKDESARAEDSLTGGGGAAYDGCEPARPSRYTFKPTVSCFEVPDLRSLDEQHKKAIWWRPADFQEFLEARMAIVKAYQQHLKDGTMSLFADDLLQRNESRRGLGLGRAKVRLNSTKAYIDAVLKEQQRQRESGRHDSERLAEAARLVSVADSEYSIANAASDAEVAWAYCREAVDTHNGEPPPAEMPRVPTLGRIKKVESFGLFQVQEGDSDEEDPRATMASDAKGFGLAPEELLQHGLRATGRRDASLQQEPADLRPLK